MVEETGTVVEVLPNSLIVEVLKTSACQSCKARQGCGQAVLSEWGQDDKQAQNNHFEIPYSKSAQVGDQVVLGLNEDAVSKVALLVYVAPLLISFVALLFIQQVTANEAVQLLVLSLAFFGSFLFLRFTSRLKTNQFVPEILHLYPRSQGPEILASSR